MPAELDVAQLSTLAIYAAMAAYAVALIAFAVDLSGRAGKPQVRRAVGIAMSTTWLGFGFQLIGVVTRAVAAGRVPWANMYEFTITFTLVAVGIFLGLSLRRDIRYLGVLVVGPTLLLLGLAVTVLYVAADGVQPALQSYWLAIHVSVATISTGVFSIGCAFAVLQLAQDSRERKLATDRADSASAASDSAGAQAGATGAGAASTMEFATEALGEGGRPAIGLAEPADAAGAAGSPRRPGPSAPDSGTSWRVVVDRVLTALPGSQTLERMSFRLNAVGFVLWTFTLIAGSIWAEHAWGRYWGWDPKEVWTFVVWIVYAGYLHARTTRGWDGRRAAYFVLVAYACLLFNFFGVNFLFTGKHGYAGV